ncbi:succinate dehydrogenase, cytochrome b556 subunit [uncultured Sphingomonas sp.]|uniref:succinate dehydrogenase, cytochrome b556 subunit n=1 Tax=uncultured Sphingomonas sp. TaxID=158754 RepID=UPI0035CA0B53
MASPLATPVHARPLSPHLGIYRWGPHMLVSILHRATGTGMALVGVPLLTWWLAAIASGPAAYARFVDIFTTSTGRLNIIGWVVGIGLTLSLFQHMMGGIRHLVLDTGAGYELRRNKQGALATMVAAVVLTLIFWLWMGLR